MRRYNRLQTTGLFSRFETSYIIPIIRANIKNGNIRIQTRTFLQERERLDTLAGKYYGDGSLWWVIAASSGIGWGLQSPPGTLIVIPILSDVMRIVGE